MEQRQTVYKISVTRVQKISYNSKDKRLLDPPISDFRKDATNLILAPYLVNIKKLSYQQSFDILLDWLQKCNSFKKLDFKPDYLVKHVLTTAMEKRIPPMKLVTLKDKNLELYNILHK